MPKQARVLVVGGGVAAAPSPKHFGKERRSCPRRTSPLYHTERLPIGYKPLRPVAHLQGCIRLHEARCDELPSLELPDGVNLYNGKVAIRCDPTRNRHVPRCHHG